MEEEQLAMCRSRLKERLQNNFDGCNVVNGKFGQLADMCTCTLTTGESNSALVLSPTRFYLNAVSDRLSAFAEAQPDCILIKLNGIIHTDDKLALKAITVQMCLSHEAEGKVFGSFSENLAFLLQCLKAGRDKKCKSVLFILEEFQMFCHGRGTQTLLYNLFDVAQSKQAPVCVIGFTSHLDVIEMLEKRVKSRFSHRQIFLFPESSDPEKKIDAFENRMALLESLLSLPSENLNEFDPVFVMFWNNNIKSLHENSALREALKAQFELNTDEKVFRDILFEVVCSISPDRPEVLPQYIIRACERLKTDDKVLMLLSLSVLEFSLVIAMKHQADIFNDQPMNFEMIYTRYSKFVSSNCPSRSLPRITVQRAFEHILSLELIASAKGEMSCSVGSNRIQKEFQMYKLSVMPHQISEAVKRYKSLPTDLYQWAQTSLI